MAGIDALRVYGEEVARISDEFDSMINEMSFKELVKHFESYNSDRVMNTVDTLYGVHARDRIRITRGDYYAEQVNNIISMFIEYVEEGNDLKDIFKYFEKFDDWETIRSIFYTVYGVYARGEHSV